MKSLKKIILVLSLLLPFAGLNAATHARQSLVSSRTYFHLNSFSTNIHHTAHPTSDADLLVAESTDSDDLSEVISRNVSFSEICFDLLAEKSSFTPHYVSPGVIPASHSFSFLRVFRI